MEKKSSVPRFLRVREFLASRLPETELLVNLLKRKLGEDRFGADAVDGKARRRASSPRSWKFWQREERARKRKREEEGESDSWRRRFCREKRRKETKKERWSKERGKLATHEWLAKRFVMGTISSANKNQSLTEKEKKIEEENASKLVSALGVDSTFMSDHLAMRALPLHRFGKNRGSRSITKAWKSAAVVHDATYLLYRRNTRDASSSSIVSNENALPKRVRETFCDGEIESLARFDVAGKFALKLINKTLRTSIKFKKIGTVKKQNDRFGENGEGLQCTVVAAVDPRRVYADDKVVPPSKKEEEDKEKLSSLPPSEKDISDARRVSKVVRARQLAGIARSDDANIDLSALQQRFRVCAVARPNNDGASLYFNANWAPIVLKKMVIHGACSAGVCEWNDLGVWRGANVEKVRSIFVNDEASDDDAATRTRIVLRFPKKGAGRKGDAIFDNDGNTKIGTIDRVTPVSIAVAVASASVLTTAWSHVVTNSKRKKGGVKVLVKSATKGDVIAFASSAKETNGDFSWW